MARPKTLTTRRERFLYDRERYLRLEREHRLYNWKWIRHPVTGKAKRNGRKWLHVRGPKMSDFLVGNASYSFQEVTGFGLPLPHTHINSLGRGHPPTVNLTGTIFIPPGWWNPHNFALIGYHRRKVKIRKKRPRDPRYTAFNLQVSGCNYFYFRNQCYRDTDILGRHPNETDIANGAPLGPPGWPSPLGYQ